MNISKQCAEHEFALYAPMILHPNQNSHIHIDDSLLVRRMAQILRFQPGDSCILFNKDSIIRIEIEYIHKKRSITARILESIQPPIITPQIIFLLPLLKKHNLEQAIVHLSELGTSTIQLIYTEKTHRRAISDHELERLSHIRIAACEVAKQFAIPTLLPPLSFHEAISHYQSSRGLYADPEGIRMNEIIQTIQQFHLSPWNITIGPEGGFTQSEIKFLHDHNFQPCVLTPMTLPAVHAAALLIGIIRTFCHHTP